MPFFGPCSYRTQCQESSWNVRRPCDCIASEHTGGDITVQLGEVEQTQKISVESEFNYSYLGWYADVNQAIGLV